MRVLFYERLEAELGSHTEKKRLRIIEWDGQDFAGFERTNSGTILACRFHEVIYISVCIYPHLRHSRLPEQCQVDHITTPNRYGKLIEA